MILRLSYGAGVNRAHHVLCASQYWARHVKRELVPWGIEGVELGDDVLEIGAGLGATTRVLASELPKLTLIELEHSSAERLRSKFSPPVEVVEADATKMPFEGGRFSAVVCFTMLHHVPSPELQDALMAEACRVLRPGGTFAGTDSLGGGVAFTMLHVADTFVRVPPETLAERLRSAGFADPITVETSSTSVRFRATKPGA
jgi:ubiquinone/menaquinone biosynthesis C-methylase UbiE